MSLEISDIVKANIRLKCLSMVVEAGSRIDATSPEEKAQQYYDFIVCNSIKKIVSDKKNTVKRKPGRPNKVKQMVQQPVVNPFGDKGRPVEIIS